MTASETVDHHTAFVTTSWDDGHPLDVRLADLLKSYGVLGTFYVPLSNQPSPVMRGPQLRDIRAIGMEIGSHTLTHATLTTVDNDRLRRELHGSKEALESVLGAPVTGTCYPRGKFNPAVRHMAVEAGYALARTTISFRVETSFDPFAMPVSLHFFPHVRSIHVRHALRERNLRGLANWMMTWGMENDLVRLSKTIFDHVRQHGGIFHIWGHSWEIEKFDLWRMLEQVLQYIARQDGVAYLTNSQAVEACARSGAPPITARAESAVSGREPQRTTYIRE